MFAKKPLVIAVAATWSAISTATVLAQDTPLALEEIIVTAQRRAENLQEIAMTVTAITAAQVQDYNLFRFDDLGALTPGLSLKSGGGFGSEAELRGVGFDSDSSASPAVDIYFNETPLDANFAFQSMYDIGQVEVLRGPQGTLRGRPSPAGALTLSTHKPELDKWGGYLSGAAGDEGTTNIQGALNLPLVAEKFALRLAAVYDEDDGNRVESVNGGKDSSRETDSWRMSLRWAITDQLEATLVHQALDSDRVDMTAVDGPGAGYNGPALSGRSGRSVQEYGKVGTMESNITNLNVAWETSQHRLVYSGAYQDNSYEFDTELDVTNAVTNFLELQNVPTDYEVRNHELRLESTNPDQFVDYLVGLWYYESNIDAGFSQPAALPGAFGTPLNPSPIGPPDADYVLYASGSIPVDIEEKAVYTNLVFHLSEKTEAALGLRYLESESERTETINTSAAFTVFNIAPELGRPPGTPLNGFCQVLVAVQPVFNGVEPFPGFCQIAIPQGSTSIPATTKEEEWVYNASIKHFFSDATMAYFRFDHSFRPAGTTVGLTAPVTDRTLIQGDSEESDSFELGLRWDLLDGRMRLNAAAFYQQFDNYIGRFNDIPYVGAGDQITSGGFTYPGDAIVQGIDIDIAGQLSESWWAKLTVAYAEGKYDDARVPCRDTNGDGRPDSGDIGDLGLADFNGETAMYCTIDSAISSVPNWTATLQSEYTFPIAGSEAYVRGLYNYHGALDDIGNLNSGYETDAYGVFNLYLGVRNANWEVSLWAKNLFDDDTLLQQTPPQTSYGAFATQYALVDYVPGRELGLSLRYVFGDN